VKGYGRMVRDREAAEAGKRVGIGEFKFKFSQTKSQYLATHAFQPAK